MDATGTLRSDQVYQVLADRQETELRFRSAMITSTAVHTATTIALLLAPLFIPAPQILNFTPVNLVELSPAPEPAPSPPPAEEEPVAEEEEVAPEPEPEPEEIEPPPPDDVPEDLEAQRRLEEEAEAQRREEERQRREEEEARREAAEAAEAARRRREEAERLAREEEERRQQPQKAARREEEPEPAQEITQQAVRGQVGMMFDGEVTQQEVTLLQFWINRVLTNIGNKWDQPTRPAGSREIVAVVHFRVGRDGSLIVGPDVRSGSGDNRYDSAAVRAIQAGQPFPLPQAYRGRTLAINLAFRQ